MSQPETDPQEDFLIITQAPDEVVTTMKNACYDCHSNKTEYPWYAHVAPVSWWLKSHINEGREHLNFSEWGSYPYKKADHKLEECIEEIEEGEMPLNSYTWTHSDARLSDTEKTQLISFFKTVRANLAE